MVTEYYNPSAIPSIVEMLFSLAEYITANITTTSVAKQQYILQAIQQTLINAVNILDAYQIQNLLMQEYTLLSRISGNSLMLSPQDLVLINNRIASMNVLIETIYPLPLSIVFNINNLTSGLPALPAYDLISFMIQFMGETVPVGLSLSNFQANSQAMAQAWLDALNFLNTNGSAFQSTTYDAVDRMYNCSQDTTNLVNNITLASNLTTTADLLQLWNSLIALPSLLRVAGLLYNDPSQQTSQSINALKFVIYNLIYITNSVLATFTVPNNLQQPNQAILRAEETLLDFAARTTGDYSQWTVIATANSLSPPYVGIIPAPGIAVPGQKLFIPPFFNTLPVADYNDSYLGTDINIGFPYTELNTWTGDFALISGLPNYVGALARAVLTPQGSLIYHTPYGSQIPPRIGQVSTASEALLLSAYLKSVLLSDTRTQAVNQITAYPAAFGQIVMTALVTPYGSAAAVPINLVFVPQSNTVTKT